MLQRVGAGGMAEVFKCRLSGIGGFDKVVVVKRILPHLAGDPSFVKMFLDEARIAANLNHPNIVQIYEIDQADGVPFIAMEYVRGPPVSLLMDRVQGRERLAPAWGHFAKAYAGVCAGLAYAHDAVDAQGQPLGIVHRDVSPQNVVVTLDGMPKLLDFGVAKARGRLSTTATGTLKGKLRYMAPEQIRAQDGTLDRRADVYAVGVCLYAATTGVLPFDGESEVQVLAAVLEGRFPRPSELLPGYPPELERIVLWAMEQDLEKRCPDCQALQEALEAFAAQGPYASSTKALAAWIRELLPDFEADSAVPRAHEASGLSATLQRPPASPASPLDGPARETALLSPGLKVALGAMAVLLLLALAAVAYLLSGHTEQPLPLRPTPPTLTLPVRPPREESAQAADAARTYLAEAERMAGENRFKHALELVAKAKSAGVRDANLDILITRLEDRLTRDLALQRAQALLKAGDTRGAIQAAKEALDVNPDDAEAQALITRAREASLRERKSAEPPRHGSRTSPPAATPAEAEKPPEKPAEQAREGSLTLTSLPEGEAFVDERSVGRTPVQLRSLAEGRHEVRVSAEGYVPQTRDVQVTGGKETQVAFELVAAERPKAEVAALVPKEPRLPPSFTARNIKDLTRVLLAVEGEAVTLGGVAPEKAKGSTASLMQELSGSLAPGQALELYPHGMYWLIVKEASKGTSSAGIRERLKSAHLRGDLITYGP